MLQLTLASNSRRYNRSDNYTSTPTNLKSFSEGVHSSITKGDLQKTETEVDAGKPHDYASLSPPTKAGNYEFSTTLIGEDTYDYESPYWAPADKKTELLRQFKKLRIQSVAEEDIE